MLLRDEMVCDGPEAVIAFAARAVAVDPPARLSVFAALVGLNFDSQIEPAAVIVPAAFRTVGPAVPSVVR